MENITKNKITLHTIIGFIRTAIHKKCYVSGYKSYYYSNNKEISYYYFTINNEDKSMIFEIKENGEIYISNYNGEITITFNLSERDILDLEALVIDIKEYRENVCLNIFNNFFSDVEDKPTSLNDLDDDDDN